MGLCILEENLADIKMVENDCLPLHLHENNILSQEIEQKRFSKNAI